MLDCVQPNSNMNSRRDSDADSIFGSLSGYIGSSTDHEIKNMARTPPSFSGPGSYELGHFGKRMRAGSISGRLRSASDLEEHGVINPYQKDLIKDLIINGDDTLQSALDKYEEGDPSVLEELLKSGVLNHRHASIDLLDDLDLDYLNVNDFDNLDDNGLSANSLNVASSSNGPQLIQDESNVEQDTREHDDGIGDLDFDGGGDIDDYSLGSSKHGSYTNLSHSTSGMDNYRQRLMSLGDLSLGSPSLHPGALLVTTPPIVLSSTNWANESINKDMFQLNCIGGSTSSVVSISSGSGGGGIAETLRAVDEEMEVKKIRPKKIYKKKNNKTIESNDMNSRKDNAKTNKKKDTNLSKVKKESTLKFSKKDNNHPRNKNDPNTGSILIPQSPADLLPEERPDDWVGAYSPESRKARIERFLEKRNHRVWTKKVKYDVRKNFADSRLRVKGRFVKKEDETLMRELMSIT